MTELETIREQRDKAVEALKRYHDEAESEHYKGDGCWCDDLLRDIEAQIARESNQVIHESAIISKESWDSLSPRVQIIRRAKAIIEALNLPEGGGVAMDQYGYWFAFGRKPLTESRLHDGFWNDGGFCGWKLPPVPGFWTDDWKTSWITRETPE